MLGFGNVKNILIIRSLASFRKTVIFVVALFVGNSSSKLLDGIRLHGARVVVRAIEV